MKTLTKISNDNPPSNRPYKGRYREENGDVMHGVYIREHKKTIDKLFINNGNLMRKYKYPRIEERHFSSPLLNDYNLHLCGGWSFNGIEDNQTIQRVINGKKPMGFYDTFSSEKFEYWKEYVKDTGLPYILSPKEKNNRIDEIGISIKGTFGNIFNLPDLIHDYQLYAMACGFSDDFVEHIREFITSIKDVEIKNYLSFDYVNQTTDEGTIITGLILGYPIETTISCMWF